MHAHPLRGLHHGVGVHLAQACDVLRHGAIKKAHVLRHIAQVRANLIAVPGRHLDAIEPDRPMADGPQPHQGLGQGRLAAAHGAHHRQHAARLRVKTQSVQHWLLAHGRCHRHLLQHQVALRSRQRHGLGLRVVVQQQVVQTLVGLACLDDVLPMPQNFLDRADGLVDQHRGGKHHAGRDHVVNGQVSPQAQRQGREQLVQQPNHAPHTARQLRGRGLHFQVFLVLFVPQLACGRLHAHGIAGLDVAHQHHGLAVGLGILVVGAHQHTRGQLLLHIGGDQQQHHGPCREHGQNWMHQ